MVQIPLYVHLVCLVSSLTTGSVKVFNFQDAVSANGQGELSYATLAEGSKEELPESFILCTSHRQARWHGRGNFLVTGRQGKPWLTLRWELEFGKVIVKVELVSELVIRLGVVDEPKLNFWNTACLAVETERGLLALTVNQKFVANQTCFRNFKLTRPLTLNDRLTVGMSYNGNNLVPEEQYQGSISNIQVHKGGLNELVKLQSEKCDKPGDYLTWENMTWKLTGKNDIITEAHDSVCEPAETYDIAFPAGLPHAAALRTCSKLGHGNMTTIRDEAALINYIRWFSQLAGEGRCKYIWTPHSDAELEGVFINMNTGTEAEFLPWYPTEPNGGRSQNSVAIKTTLGPQSYIDGTSHFSNCFSCSLKSLLTFIWMGACIHTRLGECSHFEF